MREFISIYPALCWSWVVIPFPIWEVELDGQLASEFAWRVHNPTYITHRVCKICTAVLGTEIRCLEIKSACRSGKFPLSHYFSCLHFYFAFSRGRYLCLSILPLLHMSGMQKWWVVLLGLFIDLRCKGKVV